MTILRIEHKVASFEGWKKVFDSDPINRKQSGVRRYSIFQLTDDPNYVIIDLEFDNLKNAETTLTALNKLWGNVEGKVIFKPQTQILNIVESAEI
jgi:ribose 5-phosphate isomerase